MFLSVFEIFKIGIGPSSSHTMGPMVAAARFLDDLRGGRDRVPGAGAPSRLRCRLHGSLSWTGKGHATDRAVILGLAGLRPETLEPEKAARVEAAVRATGRVEVEGLGSLAFDPESGIVFDRGPARPQHANALTLSADDADGNLYLEETYYSTGGGFVVTESEMGRAEERTAERNARVP